VDGRGGKGEARGKLRHFLKFLDAPLFVDVDKLYSAVLTQCTM